MILISPILNKELTQLAGSRRVYVCRLLIGAILLIFTFSLMPDLNDTDYYGWYQEPPGLEVFRIIIITSMVVLSLLTPIITAPVICGERQANTLGLLFMTRLKAWHIAQDKALSQLITLIALATMSFPFIFAAMLFGGVSYSMVFSGMASILATILMAAGISLFCSSICKKYMSALGGSYLGLVFLLLMLPVLGSLIDPDAAVWVNPIISLATISSSYMVRQNPEFIWSPLTTLGSGAVIYATSLLLATWQLKRLAKKGTTPIHSGPRLFGRLIRKVTPTLFGLTQRSAQVGSRNPIAWKESGIIGSRLTLMWMGIGLQVLLSCVLPVIFLSYRGGDWFMDDDLYKIIATMSFPAGVLFVSIAAGGSLAGDRQQGELDQILATRLKAPAIIYGYLRGLLAMACGLLVIPVLALITGEWLVGDDIYLTRSILVMVVYMIAPMVVGLACSTIAKTQGKAVILCLGIIATAAFGPILAAIVFDAMGADEDLIIGLSPLFQCAVLINESYNESEVYYACLHVIITAIIGVGLWAWLNLHFDRLCGRQALHLTK